MPTKNLDTPDLFAASVSSDPAALPVRPAGTARPITEHVQPTFAEVSEEYKAFEEKFKPRKTTDDCYTPELVYDAVRDYVCSRYQIDRAAIVRPFWPGGDYERAEYPAGCCVLDNPPFSILA